MSLLMEAPFRWVWIDVRSGRLAGRLVDGDASSRVEPLRQILENVVWVFEADRKAHVTGRDAGRELLVRRQLLMRSRRWMNGERACVADVGDMVEKFERVDELTPRLYAALEFEADQAAVTALKIHVSASAGLACLQAGKDDVRDVAALFEEVRNDDRVFVVLA